MSFSYLGKCQLLLWKEWDWVVPHLPFIAQFFSLLFPTFALN
jgi:hypothetical protein